MATLERPHYCSRAALGLQYGRTMATVVPGKYWSRVTERSRAALELLYLDCPRATLLGLL